ncbi:MBL fold metallo-hydrolase [Puteibacter caeruleilacunae]|nr:MBL fold metallo-hydrolase [Puteibacter caeruleilacunae]
MKKTEIQLIRNATLKLNYGGKTILVDPMLSPKHSFMSFVEQGKDLNPTVDMPMSISEVVGNVDAVFLTHAHPDHFDPAAMKALPRGIRMFAQVSDEATLNDTHFTNVSLVDERAQYDNITITRIVGKHGPDALFEVLGVVSGYILEAEGYPTIYIVGDCLWDNNIEQAIEKYNPGIIVTNSGGALFMGENRILMDVEETVKVAQKAPGAKVIAVHVEAIDHCKVSRNELKAVSEKEGLNIIAPEDGEVVSF